jgi:hypothetical protein
MAQHPAQHTAMVVKLDIKPKGITEIRGSTNMASETTSELYQTELSKTL